MAAQCKPSRVCLSLTALLALLACAMGFQPRYLATQKQVASKKNADSTLGKEEAALQDALLETTGDVNDRMTTDGDETCTSFLKHPGTMTTGGEKYMSLGIVNTVEDCQKACVQMYDFYCAAAQIRKPSTCYVTGFPVRNNYWSTHFRRTCPAGLGCFDQIRGISIRPSRTVKIPGDIVHNRASRAFFCMAQCQESDTCVGFDLVDIGTRKTKCFMAELGTFRNPGFDLYVRRC